MIFACVKIFGSIVTFLLPLVLPVEFHLFMIGPILHDAPEEEYGLCIVQVLVRFVVQQVLVNVGSKHLELFTVETHFV